MCLRVWQFINENSGALQVIILIIGFGTAIWQINIYNQQLEIQTQQLEEQVRQNAPHIASTSMCPILRPNSITNYTAKLHNFGNSPAYYDIGFVSENVSLRIFNFAECWLFDTRCGKPSLTDWKTIPAQSEQKINFQFKTENKPSISFLVVILDYKMNTVRKVSGDLQEVEPIISKIIGSKPIAPLPKFEVEVKEPILQGTFHLLDCEYTLDKETGLYLNEFQLLSKQQGLLDEYEEQIISESR